MKFVRIDLVAYGHFSSRIIDFPPNGPSFHILFGPNEAGKSTTLRAIGSLLFGIGKQSPDAFRHASDVRVGARLMRSTGEQRTFVRTRRSTGSLLDENGAVVDESVLHEWLSVQDRKAFDQMFGLSHTQLRAAGQALVDSGSVSAEVVFGAGLGGISLQRTQAALSGESARLLSETGRAGAVHDALKSYLERQKESRRSELRLGDWEQSQREVKQAEEAWNKASAEIAGLRAEQGRQEKLKTARPWLARRTDAIRDRALMGEVRLLPPSVLIDQQENTREAKEAELVASEARDQHRQVSAELASLVVPEPLAAATQRVKSLSLSLGAYRQSVTDFSGVRQEAIALGNAGREILRQAGLPELSLDEAARLGSDVAFRARVDRLGKERQDLDASLKHCREGIKRTGELLAVGSRELASLPPSRDARALRLAWRQVQSDRKLDEATRKAEDKISESGRRLKAALLKLAPWTGSPEAAAQLAPPSGETIERFEKEEATYDRKMEKIDSRLSEVDSELEKLSAKLRLHTESVPLPSEAALHASRTHRNRGWSRVLAAFGKGISLEAVDSKYDKTLPLAEAYTSAVSDADRISDNLREQSTKIAEYASISGAVQEKKALRERISDDRETLLKSAATRLREWNSIWKPLGFEPLSPLEMRGWALRHEAAVEQWRLQKREESERDSFVETQDSHRKTIASALKGVGVTADGHSWVTLLTVADETLDGIDEVERRREELQKEVERLKGEGLRSNDEGKQVESAMHHWVGQWGETVRRLQLDAEAGVGEAIARVEKLRELADIEGKRGRQEHRRAAMEENQRQFEVQANELAKELAPDLLGTVSEIAQALIERHEAAKRALTARTTLESQAANRVRAIAAAETRKERAQERLVKLLSECACATEDEFKRAAERSACARLLDTARSEAEDRLREIGDGLSIDYLVV